MENPNRQIWRSMLLVLFGLALGAIPSAIRTDQLRRQVEADRAETAQLNDALRKQLAETMEKYNDCRTVIRNDGDVRTVLVDLNHPYGEAFQRIYGASLTMPFTPSNGIPSRIATGPIWVIPRSITPHVIDGVLGAAYTHIWPDGRNDGWKAAPRAEVNP